MAINFAKRYKYFFQFLINEFRFFGALDHV
jgi:hypothetical protein